MYKITLKQLSTFSKLSFSIILSGLLFACAEGNNQAQDQTEDESKVEAPKKEKESKLIEIDGQIFSIPSPIQTAFLLKDVGTEYQSDLLNPAKKAATYTTTYDKALALGVYGADLGYATIFDQTQDAISYLAVSKKMAGELGITAVFNEETVKRFESNLGNQDSLLALVSDGFKSTDRYLKGNQQNDIGVAILAGGWIETLHFATALATTYESEKLKARIGEQKITIKNLINLLAPYSDKSEKIAGLTNSLNELKDLYANVDFSYTFVEPTTDEEAKKTVINSKSEVKMSEQQLTDITNKINEIRTSIIN
jgi:hypothetical protein